MQTGTRVMQSLNTSQCVFIEAGWSHTITYLASKRVRPQIHCRIETFLNFNASLSDDVLNL